MNKDHRSNIDIQNLVDSGTVVAPPPDDAEEVVLKDAADEEVEVVADDIL
jgi:hypothetical protein